MDLREEQLDFIVKKYVVGKYWCFVYKKVVYECFDVSIKNLMNFDSSFI